MVKTCFENLCCRFFCKSLASSARSGMKESRRNDTSSRTCIRGLTLGFWSCCNRLPPWAGKSVHFGSLSGVGPYSCVDILLGGKLFLNLCRSAVGPPVGGPVTCRRSRPELLLSRAVFCGSFILFFLSF